METVRFIETLPPKARETRWSLVAKALQERPGAWAEVAVLHYEDDEDRHVQYRRATSIMRLLNKRGVRCAVRTIHSEKTIRVYGRIPV